MCRRCKNARDLFNKILTNFGFPNWPKIHDMHFLARDESNIWQLGIESWNINEESFVSWFIQFAATWLLIQWGRLTILYHEDIKVRRDMGHGSEEREVLAWCSGCRRGTAQCKWTYECIDALSAYQCLSSIRGQSPPVAFVNASSKILHENFINPI